MLRFTVGPAQIGSGMNRPAPAGLRLTRIPGALPQGAYECRAFGAKQIRSYCSGSLIGLAAITCRRLSLAIRTFYKAGSDVTEDKRVVVLAGLVAHQSGIRAVRRSELVLSDIGGRVAEEELPDRNAVDCIERVISINIRSFQPASREKCNLEEMPLDSNHIYRVDAGGSRGHGALCRRHDIAPANRQRGKLIVAGGVGHC